MLKLKQPVEAMQEIDMALETEKESWHLLRIKAKIFANQKKWQNAIDTMTRSNEMLKNDAVEMKENSDEYWENRLFLAEWFRDLGQREKSLENYRSCLEHDPDDYDLLPPILRMALETDDYTSAMKLLNDLNEDKTPKSGRSRLVHAVIALKDEESFHFDLFETARRNQRLEMLQVVYNDSISVATSKNHPGTVAWMQFYQGTLYERYLYQRDNALNVWEKTVRESSNAVKGSNLFEARDWVVRELCNLYIEKVIHLGKGSPVAEKYLMKVKDIGTVPDLSVLWQYDTATALGVLHRLMDQEEQAKKCFRGRVKLGFDLLTDKDPSNDVSCPSLLCTRGWYWKFLCLERPRDLFCFFYLFSF